MQPADGCVQGLHVGYDRAGSRRFGKDLRGLFPQLQLPARDLGGGQLVMGGQLSQRLVLGERGQRHLSFELGRIATAGAFWGHNRAKLARFDCPNFGEYYTHLALNAGVYFLRVEGPPPKFDFSVMSSGS
ncbi:hypothetical protein BEN48_17035 [Hymenobacter glacialis]|uniref:Uncharacterized protein n=1 Tax=Hymenobacter glacialis TaxID=1908236 RepID=A0A1G1SY20_9BACT|nr:hypothetical protein BEN48_17035 [Hymenobacter glacialis]